YVVRDALMYRVTPRSDLFDSGRGHAWWCPASIARGLGEESDPRRAWGCRFSAAPSSSVQTASQRLILRWSHDHATSCAYVLHLSAGDCAARCPACAPCLCLFPTRLGT